MSTIKHAHKFKRHTYKNKEQVYFCVSDSNCTFKINCKMALGKLAECWRCGKNFIMTEVSVRQDKPHCVDCTKRRGSKEEVSIKIDIPIANDKKNISVSDPLGVKSLQDQLRNSIRKSLRDNAANDKGTISEEDDML